MFQYNFFKKGRKISILKTEYEKLNKHITFI